jgi:[ribosomal protein S5]-alanine N-acetyltransferase
MRKPRVHLAHPVATDQGDVLELIRRSRSFLRGRAGGPDTAAKYRRYLARCHRSDFVGWLIRRHDDDAVLGAIEVSQIVLGPFRSAYLGYYIGKPHTRQGYMTEALGLALRVIFGRMRLHRVEANIQPGNAASIALVKRLGFKKEGYSRRYLKIGGRWRDHERWALLVEDWRKSRTR